MAAIERFAPSPTGPLHLGHAFSALTAFEQAQTADGKFLLRIEDIDISRCQRKWETLIFKDLRWLGISWGQPFLRQSENMGAYSNALKILDNMGLIYACTCTRSAIKTAIKKPVFGPDGMVYPGTCRHKNHPDQNAALRLNMAKAISHLDGENSVNHLSFQDKSKTQHLNANTLINTCGDVVLARRDIGTSYHLAVTVDDAAQGISNVTRGMDLFDATQIHRLLQALLGLATPTYHHHRLILDENGKRLAKRSDSRAISKYRDEGATPQDIRHLVGL